MRTSHAKFSLLRVLTHILFWLINLPLAFTVLNGLVFFGWQLVRNKELSDLRGVANFWPIDVLVTMVIVGAMPLLAIVGVLLTKSYRSHTRLLQVLFGVELPIIAFTMARLIFLRTLTPVNGIFLMTALLSILAYVWYIFRRPPRAMMASVVQLLALQAAVLVGVYASLLMFFFVPIVLAWIVDIVGSILESGLGIGYYQSFWEIVTQLMAMIAFGLVFVSLIVCPFVGMLIYQKAVRRTSRVLQQQTSSQFTRFLRWSFAAAYILVIVGFAYQGSLLRFYNQMDRYRMTNSFEERSRIATDILKQKKFVSDRLVDTYLAHYLYLTDSQMSMLQQAYQTEVGWGESASARVQKWFTAAAFPFVYRGRFEEDVVKAGEYYQDIFDEPIQIAQQQKVSATLASSFSFGADQLKSSVLDRGEKDVRLVQQITSVQLDGTQQFATVSIEEEYENTSTTPQEVLYIFSLPQDAVVTDLKLGADLELASEQLEKASPFQPNHSVTNPNPNELQQPSSSTSPPKAIEDKHEGAVAPKGAANETFENQYRPRLDPALLDQVGPTQYKLRVFPIPVTEEKMAQWERNRLIEPVRNQKMRFTYVTVVGADGKVQLPTITEQRNIFSDAKTSLVQRLDDGELRGREPKINALSVVSGSAGSFCHSAALGVTLGQGYGVLPTDDQTATTTFYLPHVSNPWLSDANLTFDCSKGLVGTQPTLQGKRLAILADASYSMGVTDWWTYLEEQLLTGRLLDETTVDLYYFNDLVSQPVSVNQQKNNPKAWDQVAFGKTDRLQALKSVAGNYDAVLMFTDGSEADAAADEAGDLGIAQPIFMIHRDGFLPQLPPDLTNYLQVNEARVSQNGTQALQELALYSQIKKHLQSSFLGQEILVVVGERGTWVTVPGTVSEDAFSAIIPQLPITLVSSTEPMAKVAAHRQVELMMRQGAGRLRELAFLDDLNRMAQNAGIVTPFSSLIVLVTPEQRQQLEQASLHAGRYVVNYDLGEEQLMEPTSGGFLGTSAVPEPHEWLLIITGAAVILLMGRRRLATVLAQLHA